METEQSWKRSAARRVELRGGSSDRATDGGPGLRWATILGITVPCAVAGAAIGVVLGTALAPPAAVAYIAAALFVAVLAFAIHFEGDGG